MDLIYPINFVGHDKWIESGYSLNWSTGDVITSDGELLGVWRVMGYTPELDNEGGYYEFIMDGRNEVTFTEEFAILDSRMSRGFSLSNLTRTIKEWHEAKLP